MNYRPVVLTIIDGLGIAPNGPGNTVSLSNISNLRKLTSSYFSATLSASGEGVGLPWGETGNSEVGHINLGAGRIVVQDLPRINSTIADGSFFQNPAFLKAEEHVKKNNSKLHIMGLLGTGAAHSYEKHMYSLIEFATQKGIKNIFLHLFTDGRDTAPKSALGYLTDLEKAISGFGSCKIATIGGRYFGMDRDKHWDRIMKSYNSMVLGEGPKYKDAKDVVATSYEKGITDEFVEPSVICEGQKPIAKIEKGDALIFFNFRPDRALQITKTFVMPSLPDEVKRTQKVEDLLFVAMTEYDKDLPVEIAFNPVNVEYPVARVISEAGLKQLHIAETEKYAHVTVFFDGGVEANFVGEDRVLIPSPQVPKYDEKPEMSARELTDRVLRELATNKYDFIVINFANCDMVGHTGNIDATKIAIETVDNSVARIANEVLNMGGATIITADHGNCESMRDAHTGMMETDHTINPVPLCIVAKGFEHASRSIFDLGDVSPDGFLGDVAPTILDLMGLKRPKDMHGFSFANLSNK